MPRPFLVCGAGRSRTAVQTSNRDAFYMLIRVKRFSRPSQTRAPKLILSLLRFSPGLGGSAVGYPILTSTSGSQTDGTGWREMSCPHTLRGLSKPTKLRLKQQERSCFRLLYFASVFKAVRRVSLHAYKAIILAVKTGQPRFCVKKRTLVNESSFSVLFGGPDETRTRDPMRDRHVF